MSDPDEMDKISAEIRAAFMWWPWWKRLWWFYGGRNRWIAFKEWIGWIPPLDVRIERYLANKKGNSSCAGR